MGKRLFIDMDGTIARFHDRILDGEGHVQIELMYEKGFFKQLEPFQNMVDGIKLFIKTHPECEVYTLSAAQLGDPPGFVNQKNAWIDEYLPEVDKEHRIFSECGVPKTGYIPGSVTYSDFLLDDYNKNLNEWIKDGGASIKCKNNINHRGTGKYGGDIGNLWKGDMVSNLDTPEKIVFDLENLLGVEHTQIKSLDIVREGEQALEVRSHEFIIKQKYETIKINDVTYDLLCEYENHDKNDMSIYIQEGGEDAVITLGDNKAIIGLFSTKEEQINDLFDYIEATLPEKNGFICYWSQVMENHLELATKNGRGYPIITNAINGEKNSSFFKEFYRNYLQKVNGKKFADIVEPYIVPVEYMKIEQEEPLEFSRKPEHENSIKTPEDNKEFRAGYSDDVKEKHSDTVKTNIGEVPIEDFREIVAQQNGFESYEDMYKQGYRLGNQYDKEPEVAEGRKLTFEGQIESAEVSDGFNNLLKSADIKAGGYYFAFGSDGRFYHAEFKDSGACELQTTSDQVKILGYQKVPDEKKNVVIENDKELGDVMLFTGNKYDCERYIQDHNCSNCHIEGYNEFKARSNYNKEFDKYLESLPENEKVRTIEENGDVFNKAGAEFMKQHKLITHNIANVSLDFSRGLGR